ncbi:MAG: hypothetical protein J6U20_14430 [Fibrobacter sp.]|nr:hypothetical protein [Fibrobacter sp.]
MLKLFLMMAMLLAFSACGGDSSSSAEPTDSELESSSDESAESSSSYTPKSATTVVDTKAKDMRLSDKPEDGTVIDTVNGATYKTRTVGIFTWTTENANVKNPKVKSTCYAYDDANCDPYGRLYMGKGAQNVCPEGFNIPTVSDLRFMKQQDPNVFAYAGTCFKRDTLECEGIGESAQYLAYGDSAVAIDTSGRFSATGVKENGFYSLLCIKYRTILENEEDLPECKKNRFYNYPSIYVANSNADFTCENGEWESSRATGPCGAAEEGEKYVINELVFICKNGHWRWTTPKESGVECTKKNLYEEFIVNSFRYACTDSGLVKLAFPATELGLCYSKRKGELAQTDSISYFICNGDQWRRADIDEVIGKCDSAIAGTMKKYRGTYYTCRTNNKWEQSRDEELELGGCTADLIDSVRKDSLGYIYTCTNRYYWDMQSQIKALGDCKSSLEGNVGTFGPYGYVCAGGKWNRLTSLDTLFGNCTSNSVGLTGTKDGITYICKYSNSQYGWEKATDVEAALGFCSKSGDIQELDGVYYQCMYSEWRIITVDQVLSGCSSASGEVRIVNGMEYVCDTTAYNNRGEWFRLTTADSLLGEYCRTAILNKVVKYGNTIYVCHTGTYNTPKYWAMGTMLDYLGQCTEARLGERAFNGIDTVVCIHNVCDGKYKRTYTYNGKDTTVCVNVNNGFDWAPIIRDSIVDKRDSEVYGVLTFGTQKWLNRELHYTIETAYSGEGYPLTHYPSEFLDTYNYYYTWDDAFGNGSDICPDGTHIPSEAEWTTLFDYARAIMTEDGFDMMFSTPVDRNMLTNLYGLSLKRRGFVDMDYFGPREGAPTNIVNPLNANLAGNEDISNMFYWITGSGNSSSTGNVIHVDTNFYINYEADALKEDAYMIRCILD